MSRVEFEWLAANPRGRRADLSMVRQAVRNGWLDGPEHADRRHELVRRLGDLIDSGELNNHGALSVFRTLLAMDQADQSV